MKNIIKGIALFSMGSLLMSSCGKPNIYMAFVKTSSMNQAQKDLASGNYSGAITFLETYVSANPTDYTAKQMLATAYVGGAGFNMLNFIAKYNDTVNAAKKSAVIEQEIPTLETRSASYLKANAGISHPTDLSVTGNTCSVTTGTSDFNTIMDTVNNSLTAIIAKSQVPTSGLVRNLTSARIQDLLNSAWTIYKDLPVLSQTSQIKFAQTYVGIVNASIDFLFACGALEGNGTTIGTCSSSFINTTVYIGTGTAGSLSNVPSTISSDTSLQQYTYGFLLANAYYFIMNANALLKDANIDTTKLGTAIAKVQTDINNCAFTDDATSSVNPTTLANLVVPNWDKTLTSNQWTNPTYGLPQARTTANYLYKLLKSLGK